jgi:HSP20 family molecular chaperone IbpA
VPHEGGRKVTCGDDSEFPYRLSRDGDRVHLVAELAGIREEHIRLDLERTTLIISAATREKQYRKEIALPWKVRLGTKRFRRGILELTLEKDVP